MEKSFKSIVDQSRSILILLPQSPSFDQAGAALSLLLALEGKKDVAVSCPTSMKVEFNRLVGVDKISDEIGSKNLVLKFGDYPSENIERVSYDIENQQFRLTVIPKPQLEPPKKDQVEVSYSGVSADTTILVGGNSKEDFPALLTNELLETRIVHIGISDLNIGGSRNLISLARPASSVSEIMAEYIKEIEGGFHPDIATNLLSGIHEGSNNFNKREVSANTFKLAGELMAAGGKYTRKEEFRPKPSFNFPHGLIPGMPGPQFPPRVLKGAAALDDDTPEKEESGAPVGETAAPKSWLKPKIYSGNNKGTSVS